jgi:transposase-like protein
MSILSQPIFHDEQAAYDFLESVVWPHGPVCPHCGGVERIGKMGGKSTRIGTYKCYQCRKPFTVKIGTIFEASHVPLHVWLQAMYLIVGSKKGISSNQLHRTLGVTLKTAWFMSHRIREAMRSDAPGFFGEGGGIVEADETFIGQEPGAWKGAKGGYYHKMKVLALIDRDTGHSRAMVIDRVDTATIKPLLLENISREARLCTDESGIYRRLGGMFADRARVDHSKGEYVNLSDSTIHTNTIEGYFSIFKRGMRGIYQFCGKQHLHRYLAEFDFRYCNREANGINDAARADILLRGVVGRRLTYETTCARA